MKIRTFVFGLCMFAGIGTKAHDFSATINGQRLYFEITNKSQKTIAVTYNGGIADKKAPMLNGIVEIPSKVKYHDIVYEVNAIGQKAFANAKHLKGIVMPSGIKSIGDFAFENCDSLRDVVFPGNSVSLGQGVFFMCPSISNVTIGSDWKSIDFAMFRWSKMLYSVSIPAKIEKIQGIKKLKYLTTINVDSNNAMFASYDGMLYSKDCTIYYTCPRAFKGNVVIKEGVTKVINGALVDCISVTSLDLPSSLQVLSFRETSRMKLLERIVMRAKEPMFTGYHNGIGKFFFQLANEKVQIVVLSSSKKRYENIMSLEAGEYSENTESIPYMVTQAELPTKKNLKGVKQFDKE